MAYRIARAIPACFLIGRHCSWTLAAIRRDLPISFERKNRVSEYFEGSSKSLVGIAERGEPQQSDPSS